MVRIVWSKRGKGSNREVGASEVSVTIIYLNQVEHYYIGWKRSLKRPSECDGDFEDKVTKKNSGQSSVRL